LTLQLPNVYGVWCRRLPTQLLEAGLAVVLLLGSIWAWDRVPFNGAIFLVNLAAYGIGRWGLELTRESIDQVGSVRLHRAISAVLVALALAGLLYIGLGGPVTGWREPAHGAGLTQAPELADGSGLPTWSFLLAPLAVLAVLSLFRFVGCASFGAASANTPVSLPPMNPATGQPDYITQVKGEMDLVSYWRLQEPSTTPVPSPAGAAVDEKSGINGRYNLPPEALKTPPQTLQDNNDDLSPAGSQTLPPTDWLTLGQPGLDFEPGNTSMAVFGGYVEVPHDPQHELDSFTLEAVVFPDSTMMPDRFSAVLEFGDMPTKMLGFGLYAGPEDPQNADGSAFVWQVWVGDGKNWVNPDGTPAHRVIGAKVARGQANYLAATYDNTHQLLALWVFYTGMDLTQIEHMAMPVPYAKNTVPVANLLIGIGRSIFTGVYPPLRYPFHGRIQEVAIYKSPLSGDVIMKHAGAAITAM
jgi:hypothetical protein